MSIYRQKAKASRADLHYIADYVFSVPYCEAASVLKWEDAEYCNGGLYGWNWDGYTLRASNGARVIICTGYRNTTGARAPRDILKKYNARAEKITSNRALSLDDMRKQLHKNRERFADALIQYSASK